MSISMCIHYHSIDTVKWMYGYVYIGTSVCLYRCAYTCCDGYGDYGYEDTCGVTYRLRAPLVGSTTAVPLSSVHVSYVGNHPRFTRASL